MQRISMHKEDVKREKRLREQFPVHVEIESGFYVVGSKMNGSKLPENHEDWSHF
jgi:hypothetical protein